MTRRILLTVAMLTTGALAHADAARPFAAPSAIQQVTPPGAGSLGQVTIALTIVLAFIFGAAWLTRRMRGIGKTSTAALDVVAQLSLGQKERAVLIRCGSTQILLGVAPGRVNTLHVLAPGECPLPDPPPATGGGQQTKPSFKALLMRSLGK